jgi:hypothetical protein
MLTTSSARHRCKMYNTKRWVLSSGNWNIKLYQSSNQERSDMTNLLTALLSSTPQPLGTQSRPPYADLIEAAVQRPELSQNGGLPCHTIPASTVHYLAPAPFPALATQPRARTAVEDPSTSAHFCDQLQPCPEGQYV